MKALYPDGRGRVRLAEREKPALFDNAALCRTSVSLISPGTERGIIESSIGKDPEEIVRTGVTLGYNGAGIVEEVRGDALGLRPGQRAAFYGGPYVFHGEYLAVPRALVYPIPETLSLDQAAFMGLGAIALHGFRQGKCELGETCLVAGAGIIGNLCAQLALLAGCRVVVTDREPERIGVMGKCVPPQSDIVCVTPQEAESAIRDISQGQGADAVFLCMGVQSAEPMHQALETIRRGGRIVILGVLDIQVPREPFFYKEAEIAISRAAGPGRYDPHYERDGTDYPLQYCRWTEGRNLAEALRLIASGRLRVDPLISARYPIARFGEPYRRILEGEPGLGYLLDWTTL